MVTVPIKDRLISIHIWASHRPMRRSLPLPQYQHSETARLTTSVWENQLSWEKSDSTPSFHSMMTSSQISSPTLSWSPPVNYVRVTPQHRASPPHPFPNRRRSLSPPPLYLCIITCCSPSRRASCLKTTTHLHCMACAHTSCSSCTRLV